MSTPRGKAKQALVAHAAVVAKAFDKTADEIRAAIREMTEAKAMSEREMVEAITAHALAALHEAPLAELWAKLSEYEVRNALEKR
jgi:hypothetical protein